MYIVRLASRKLTGLYLEPLGGAYEIRVHGRADKLGLHLFNLLPILGLVSPRLISIEMALTDL